MKLHNYILRLRKETWDPTVLDLNTYFPDKFNAGMRLQTDVYDEWLILRQMRKHADIDHALDVNSRIEDLDRKYRFTERFEAEDLLPPFE